MADPEAEVLRLFPDPPTDDEIADWGMADCETYGDVFAVLAAWLKRGEVDRALGELLALAKDCAPIKFPQDR